MDITDYYKPSEALELITKVLPNEDPELSLIDAIRMGPIRTWVFHKQGRLRLKSRLSRTLIPSDLWWNLSEDLTRGDLRDRSALRVDLTAGRAHFLLVDGHREYLSGELQIHKAGLTQWLNGLENLDTEEQANVLDANQEKSSRKRDVEADAIMRNRIKMVLSRARKLWPGKKKRPSHYAMAVELTSTRHADLKYKFPTIKKILAGTYRPSKRLGIPGL